jgi:hypothetical protein
MNFANNRPGENVNGGWLRWPVKDLVGWGYLLNQIPNKIGQLGRLAQQPLHPGRQLVAIRRDLAHAADRGLKDELPGQLASGLSPGAPIRDRSVADCHIC